MTASSNILDFLRNGHAAGMRWGSSLDWALVVSILVCASILVCIVMSRLVFRGHEADPRALWISVAGLVVAPLVLLPISTFAVLRYSKQEAFCATCHSVMQPYVDDMHNPNNRALAARHFRDGFARNTECYSCHATPGIYGMVEAKLVGLHEALAYLTGDYRLPLKMALPFPNQACLQCHEGTRKFMAEDSHLDSGKRISQDLVSGDVSCEECHGIGHQIATGMVNALAERK